MSEDFGPTFITVTDEDGTEIVLEFVDALEHNGQMYQAFFPAETEDEEEDPDSGLVILKVIHEDGEDLLSTLDSEEELDTVYNLFMENLFNDEEKSPKHKNTPNGARHQLVRLEKAKLRSDRETAFRRSRRMHNLRRRTLRGA